MQPVHFAARGGHVDILRAFVFDYNVDPNVTSEVR